MKTNHNRGDRDTKHHHDLNDPWHHRTYNCGHRGAARNRKGVKKARITAARRYADLVIREELMGGESIPHLTSTIQWAVKPSGVNAKRGRLG